MFESLASCFAFRCSAPLNMTESANADDLACVGRARHSVRAAVRTREAACRGLPALPALNKRLRNWLEL